MSDRKDETGLWGPLWREGLMALSLGWDLAIPIFAGVLLGYYLDRQLGTGHVFTLGLLTLGIAIGYYNLARFIRRVDARDRQQDAETKAETEVKEQETDRSGER